MLQFIARWAWCAAVVDVLFGLALGSFTAVFAGAVAILFFELGGGHR